MTTSGTQLSGVTFQRYDAERARGIRTEIENVYRASYISAIASGDPFDSVEAFMHRFESYSASPIFDLVVAYRDGLPIGQTWGWPLANTLEKPGWWAGLISEPEPGFTAENGTRTFALSEIMVRQDLAGHGIAHALHDELLAVRPEQRATLLVEPDNANARRAYSHWGWRHVGQLRPAWEHAPLFDVMILPLPLPVLSDSTGSAFRPPSFR